MSSSLPLAPVTRGGTVSDLSDDRAVPNSPTWTPKQDSGELLQRPNGYPLHAFVTLRSRTLASSSGPLLPPRANSGLPRMRLANMNR